MPEYYKNVPGWFTFEKLYREMADKYPAGHFCELGTYKGRSAIFIYEYAKEKGYQITLDVVDPWNNIGNVGSELVGEEVYQEFLSHLSKSGSTMSVRRTTSLEASKLYNDESLDFVFVDGDHDKWACYDDIRSWYPKIKSGGTIAGHDVDQPWVLRSVQRFCEENKINYKKADGDCWVIEK